MSFRKAEEHFKKQEEQSKSDQSPLQDAKRTNQRTSNVEEDALSPGAWNFWEKFQKEEESRRDQLPIKDNKRANTNQRNAVHRSASLNLRRIPTSSENKGTSKIENDGKLTRRKSVTYESYDTPTYSPRYSWPPPTDMQANTSKHEPSDHTNLLDNDVQYSDVAYLKSQLHPSTETKQKTLKLEPPTSSRRLSDFEEVSTMDEEEVIPFMVETNNNVSAPKKPVKSKKSTKKASKLNKSHSYANGREDNKINDSAHSETKFQEATENMTFGELDFPELPPVPILPIYASLNSKTISRDMQANTSKLGSPVQPTAQPRVQRPVQTPVQSRVQPVQSPVEPVQRPVQPVQSPVQSPVELRVHATDDENIVIKPTMGHTKAYEDITSRKIDFPELPVKSKESSHKSPKLKVYTLPSGSRNRSFHRQFSDHSLNLAPRLNLNVPECTRGKIWDLADRKIPGKVLIFNHKTFQRIIEPRNGTDVDVHKLITTFKSMNFQLETCMDLKHEEIKQKINEYTAPDQSYKDYGCLIIFILTHGKSSGRLWAQDEEYHISELWGPLRECAALKTIPILFFIQACRVADVSGAGDNEKYEERLLAEIDAPDPSTSVLPHERNFFFAFSTAEGKLSFRDPVNGSYFIQILCENIKKIKNSNNDLLTVMTYVTKEVTEIEMSRRENSDTRAEEEQVRVSGQTPVFVSFLDYRIYYGRQPTYDVVLPSYKLPVASTGNVHILYNENEAEDMKNILSTCFQNLHFTVTSKHLDNQTNLLQELTNISSTGFDTSNAFFLVLLTSIKGDKIEKYGNITFDDCKKPFLARQCPSLIGKPKVFMFINSKAEDNNVRNQEADGNGSITTKFFNEHSDILQFTCYEKDSFVRFRLLLETLTFKRENLLNIFTRALQGVQKSSNGHMSYIESTLCKNIQLGPVHLGKEMKYKLIDKLEENVNNSELSKAGNITDILEEDIYDEYYQKVRNEEIEQLTFLENIAKKLFALGRVEKSSSLYDECLMRRRRVLGSEHVDTMSTMHALAGILKILQRYGEAKSLYEECLANRRRILGENHVNTRSTSEKLKAINLNL